MTKISDTLPLQLAAAITTACLLVSAAVRKHVPTARARRRLPGIGRLAIPAQLAQ